MSELDDYNAKLRKEHGGLYAPTQLDYPEPKAGWGAMWRAAGNRTLAGLYGIPEAMGMDSLQDRRLAAEARADATSEWAAPQLGIPGSYEEAEWGKNMTQFVGGQLVNTAPQMLSTLGAAFVPGVGPALAAGMTGAFALSDTLQNQREQAGRTNLPTALAAAGPYAAVDYASGGQARAMRALGRMGTVGAKELGAVTEKNLLQRTGQAIAEMPGAKGVALRTGLDVGKTALEEAGGEAFQEVMNTAARRGVDPGVEYFSDEAMGRYKESAIVGGMIGGLMGGVTHPFARRDSHDFSSRPADRQSIDQTGGSNILTGQPVNPPATGLNLPPAVPPVPPAGPTVTGAAPVAPGGPTVTGAAPITPPAVETPEQRLKRESDEDAAKKVAKDQAATQMLTTPTFKPKRPDLEIYHELKQLHDDKKIDDSEFKGALGSIKSGNRAGANEVIKTAKAKAELQAAMDKLKRSPAVAGATQTTMAGPTPAPAPTTPPVAAAGPAPAPVQAPAPAPAAAPTTAGASVASEPQSAAASAAPAAGAPVSAAKEPLKEQDKPKYAAATEAVRNMGSGVDHAMELQRQGLASSPNQADRLMNQMEVEGIVGPMNNKGERDVMRPKPGLRKATQDESEKFNAGGVLDMGDGTSFMFDRDHKLGLTYVAPGEKGPEAKYHFRNPEKGKKQALPNAFSAKDKLWPGEIPPLLRAPIIKYLDAKTPEQKNAAIAELGSIAKNTAKPKPVEKKADKPIEAKKEAQDVAKTPGGRFVAALKDFYKIDKDISPEDRMTIFAVAGYDENGEWTGASRTYDTAAELLLKWEQASPEGKLARLSAQQALAAAKTDKQKEVAQKRLDALDKPLTGKAIQKRLRNYKLDAATLAALNRRGAGAGLKAESEPKTVEDLKPGHEHALDDTVLNATLTQGEDAAFSANKEGRENTAFIANEKAVAGPMLMQLLHDWAIDPDLNDVQKEAVDDLHDARAAAINKLKGSDPALRSLKVFRARVHALLADPVLFADRELANELEEQVKGTEGRALAASRKRRAVLEGESTRSEEEKAQAAKNAAIIAENEAKDAKAEADRLAAKEAERVAQEELAAKSNAYLRKKAAEVLDDIGRIENVEARETWDDFTEEGEYAFDDLDRDLQLLWVIGTTSHYAEQPTTTRQELRLLHEKLQLEAEDKGLERKPRAHTPAPEILGQPPAAPAGEAKATDSLQSKTAAKPRAVQGAEGGAAAEGLQEDADRGAAGEDAEEDAAGAAGQRGQGTVAYEDMPEVLGDVPMDQEYHDEDSWSDMLASNPTREKVNDDDVSIGQAGLYVPLDTAVRLAKKWMSARQLAMPFQYSHMLGINSTDWDRVMRAVTGTTFSEMQRPRAPIVQPTGGYLGENPFPQSTVQEAVYHGTQKNFDVGQMQGGDLGIHFGSMYQAADRGGKAPEDYVYGRATIKGTPDYEVQEKLGEILEPTGGMSTVAAGQLGKRRMIKAFINLKNPLRMEEPVGGAWHNPALVRDALAKVGIKLPDALDKLITGFTQSASHISSSRDRMLSGQSLALDKITAFLKTKGYDGIVYANNFEGKVFARLFGEVQKGQNIIGRDSYIVFDASQINTPNYDVQYSLRVSPSAGTSTVTGRERAPSLKRAMRRISNLFDAGTITADQFAAQTSAALDAADEATTTKARAARQRGHLIIREKLLAAQRRGEISADTVEFADWMLRQNPQWATDLGIAIEQAKEGTESTSGFYTPMSRILTLIKGQDDSLTAVHEILHHLERMMPQPVQNAIRREWSKQLARAHRKAMKGDNENMKAYYSALMEYHFAAGTPDKLVQAKKLLQDGLVDMDAYAHYDPSEFWAVNGSAIMEGRYNVSDSILGRVRQWLSELVQRIKGAFGLRSNASIINALNSLARSDGQYLSGMQISGYDGVHNMYAGVKARDQDKQAQLQRYHELTAGGWEPDLVRGATGWWQGMDGKLRYEFSDDKAQWTFSDLNMFETYDPHAGRTRRKETTYKLDDVITHDELFKRYPKLRNMRVRFVDGRPNVAGSFLGNTIEINRAIKHYNAEHHLQTLMHEVQHAIQYIEGFSPGSGASYVAQQLPLDLWMRASHKAKELAKAAVDKNKKLYRAWGDMLDSDAYADAGAQQSRVNELEAAIAQAKEDGDKAQELKLQGEWLKARRELARMRNDLFKKHFAPLGYTRASDITAQIHVTLKAADTEELYGFATAAEERMEKAQKALKAFEQGTRAQQTKYVQQMLEDEGLAEDYYMAALGETEARDTEYRLRLTQAQRDASTPLQFSVDQDLGNRTQRTPFLAKDLWGKGPAQSIVRIPEGQKPDQGRRTFLIGMAAALAAGRVGAKPTLGKARAIPEAVMAQRLPPAVEKILVGNGHGTMNMQGGKAIKEALDIIARTGPAEVRALAAEIKALMPDSGIGMQVDKGDWTVHGAVEFDPVVRLRLMDGPKTHGMTYDTFLHEALHAAVAARYKTLNTGVVRENDAVLGMSAPAAAKALEQFKNLFTEFRRVAVPALNAMKDTKSEAYISLDEATNSPDEFFVRALTDPHLQAWMATKEYEGKTLWQRFKDWVKKGLTIFHDDVGTTPSWLDAALLASDDLAKAMQGDKPDWSRLRAIERAKSKRSAVEEPQVMASTRVPGFQNVEKITAGFPPLSKETAKIAYKNGVEIATGVSSSWAQAARFTRDILNGISRADKDSALAAAATRYADAIDRLMLDRLTTQRKVASIVDDFKRLPAAERERANNFMHESTISNLWGFNPGWITSQRDDKGEFLKVKYDAGLWQRFRELTPEAQAVVQAAFKSSYDQLMDMRRAVLAKADTVYTDADEKKEFIDRFDKLMNIYENNPYMPLKRFGNWVVVAKSPMYQAAEEALKAAQAAGNETPAAKKRLADARKAIAALETDDDHYRVSFRETRGEAQSTLNEWRNTFGENVEIANRDSGYTEHFASSVQTLGLISRMRAVTDDAEIADNAKSTLAKLLTDFELSMISEASVRQSERRRKRITGADRDMMRSFGTKGMSVANFVAAIDSGGAAENALAAMKRETNRFGVHSGLTREQRSAYFNEISKRHYMGFDYKPSAVADWMMRTSSVFQLLFSPAYHLINALQPLTVSAPWLAGRHGMTRSLAFMTSAYKEVGPHMLKIAKAIEHGKYDDLPGDVRAVIQNLVDRGAISADQIFEHGRTKWKTESSKYMVPRALDKVNKGLDTVASTVELTNRIVTAMAAYRLGIADGVDAATATESAYRAIYETHGDYSGFNAPRAMRHPVLRVLTQYRKFQMIQLGMWGRLVRDALNRGGKLTKDEAAVARAQLGYLLGMMFAVGGTMGLPAASAIGWVVNGILGVADPDDPDDWEMRVRKAIDNPTIADLLLKGIPYGTVGVDLSKRATASDLLTPWPFVDMPHDRDSTLKAIGAVTGPFVGGLIPQVVDGVSQLAAGNYWKGIENLLPKGIANMSKGLRFYTQGLTMKNGDVVLSPEEFNIFEAAMQGVGLPTAEVTNRQFIQKAKFDADAFYKARMTAIKRSYADAHRSGDYEAMAQAREAWASMNASRKAHDYKPSPMSELLKAPAERAKREKSAIGGVIPAGKRDAGALRQLEELTD